LYAFDPGTNQLQECLWASVEVLFQRESSGFRLAPKSLICSGAGFTGAGPLVALYAAPAAATTETSATHHNKSFTTGSPYSF
jgi:hypothetical protein